MKISDTIEQEVIEALTEGIRGWRTGGYDTITTGSEVLARIFYHNHIAPLIRREFLEQDKPNGTKTPSLKLHVEKKGTCQTCGGRKKLYCNCPDCCHREPLDCPDCDGTGECQHTYLLAHNQGEKPICSQCKEPVNRRSGGVRRDAFKYFYGTVIDDYFPEEPRRVYKRSGKDVGWIYDHRILEDRRKDK